MIEQFTIETIEQELSALYKALETTSDIEERKYIQAAIQNRNLKLTRLMPNE